MRQWRSHLCILAGLAGKVAADIHPVRDFEGYQNGVYGDPPKQTYRSSNITSPIFNIDTDETSHLSQDKDESAHLFLNLDYTASGPYVFRGDDLSLVYAAPEYDYTMNARVQSVNGTDYLTFWHGAKNRGDSQGFCVFYDQNYRLAFNVTLGPPLGVEADMHECQVTPDGKVLLTGYQDTDFDLSGLGGEVEGVLADGCFQEIDVRSGVVEFTWCASGWFDVGLGYWGLDGPENRKREGGLGSSEGFDAFHVNSLQKTEEGNYLVSLRNMKALAYIDGGTGEPLWVLGGKANDFEDVTPESVLAANPDSGGALSFGWQHHARFVDDDPTLDCKGSSCSRGRLLRVNTTNSDHLTVELVQDYRSPNGLGSVIFGSMQSLPDSSTGSALVSWGLIPEFDEFSEEGGLIRNVQYARIDPEHSFAGSGSISSYRVFKQSWHGYPTWPPDIAVDEDGTLWVSWNGATEVRSWAVYGSNQASALGPEAGTWNSDRVMATYNPLKSVERQGFETKIKGGGSLSAFVKVAALNARGEVVGMTRTLETRAVPSVSSCLLQDTMSFTCLIRLLV